MVEGDYVLDLINFADEIIQSLKKILLFRLIFIAALLLTLSFLINRSVEWFFKRSNFIEEEVEKTYQGVIRSTFKYVSVTILIIYIIGQFINIRGILTGAGIIGVILGFAAQAMLKDILLGFFRLTDKEFRVGNYVTFNGVISGTVEEIGIRFVQIREWSGKLLSIPHGEIRTIQNYSKGKMRVIERITVSYQEEPERIKGILDEVCKLCNEKYGASLLRGIDGMPKEDFRYFGITDLNPNLRYAGYEVTIVGLVKPDYFFETSGKVRFELMSVFHKHSVKMPVSNVVFQTKENDFSQTIQVPDTP